MFKRRNPLQRLWLNDMIGSLSLAEIVGTVIVVLGAIWLVYVLL